MMAQTKPMNQPSVAKPRGGSLTGPDGWSPVPGETEPLVMQTLSPNQCPQVHGLVCGPQFVTTPLPSGNRQGQRQAWATDTTGPGGEGDALGLRDACN